MNEGPLTEKELQWLDDMLEKYGSEESIVDVAELDGLLTAVLSGPRSIEPSEWLVALWGGQNRIPRWSNEREMNRFMSLCFQHMNDIADRLAEFPEQFDPLFGMRETEGQEFTVVEEWCFGYMRGVALSDWSSLPASLQPALDAIALHGKEENFPQLEALSPEELEERFAAIRPAALALHDYWIAQPDAIPEPQEPLVADQKPGRNDPCFCGSGKKYKHCCLH
ncbi:YecA family protein [Cronobacter dublinensis]|uniref:YecA/YgfB family protein n=1 Tax=Cronobacter dublinensis TaxID=413497 RepID=UPI000CFBFD01|nr:YecA family protein [Cronobacter dublinensis]